VRVENSCNQVVTSCDVKKLIEVVCGWRMWFGSCRGFIVEGLSVSPIDMIFSSVVKGQDAHQDWKVVERVITRQLTATIPIVTVLCTLVAQHRKNV